MRRQVRVWIAAACLVAAVAAPADAQAPGDRVLVRDDGVQELYALDGMLLYGRVVAGRNDWWPATTRRWMRVVDGRQRSVRGMPRDAEPSSIGRDASGRVVVVVRRASRWWRYDLRRDVARPFRIRGSKGCVVEAVAVWRSRVAHVERCREDNWDLVLRDGASRRRVTGRLGAGTARLVLRKRSLAVVMELSALEQTVWRILDDGRRCVQAVAGTIEENGIWAGIGAGRLTWAIAGYEFDGLRYSGLRVWDIELSGRCQASPVPRATPRSLLPRVPIHGTYRGSGPAIDGRTLYYATDTEIHALRLPTGGAGR